MSHMPKKDDQLSSSDRVSTLILAVPKVRGDEGVQGSGRAGRGSDLHVRVPNASISRLIPPAAHFLQAHPVQHP